MSHPLDEAKSRGLISSYRLIASESWDQAELLRLGITHVDCTEIASGCTWALPVQEVSSVQLEAEVTRADGKVWTWGSVYRDALGTMFGAIRCHCRREVVGLPPLPMDAPRKLVPEAHVCVAMGHAEASLRGEPIYTYRPVKVESGGTFTTPSQPPPPPPGFAERIVELVKNRGSDYAHPSDNHQLTADLWSAWASRRLGVSVSFSAEDVCVLNVLQKLSRLAHVTKDDSWLDVLGYGENVAMLRSDQRNSRSASR